MEKVHLLILRLQIFAAKYAERTTMAMDYSDGGSQSLLLSLFTLF